MNETQKDMKLLIGAGEYNNNPGWLHTQEEELNVCDETTWQHRFEPNSITAILAEHVWEHLTYAEGVAAAKICFTYLKPSGYIRCAVPDGYFPDESYQRIVQVSGPGPKDHPAIVINLSFRITRLSTCLKAQALRLNCLNIVMRTGRSINRIGMEPMASSFGPRSTTLETRENSLRFPH